jgi:hypothetical protein
VSLDGGAWPEWKEAAKTLAGQSLRAREIWCGGAARWPAATAEGRRGARGDKSGARTREIAGDGEEGRRTGARQRGKKLGFERIREAVDGYDGWD